jgi:hypothetical protein
VLMALSPTTRPPRKHDSHVCTIRIHHSNRRGRGYSSCLNAAAPHTQQCIGFLLPEQISLLPASTKGRPVVPHGRIASSTQRCHAPPQHGIASIERTASTTPAIAQHPFREAAHGIPLRIRTCHRAPQEENQRVPGIEGGRIAPHTDTDSL